MTACNSAHASILVVQCSYHTAWKYFSFSQCRLWKCFVPCQKVQKWALDLMGKALHCLPQWVVRYWTPPIQATLWSCIVCHKTSVRNAAMLVVMSYWASKLSYLVYAQTRKENVVCFCCDWMIQKCKFLPWQPHVHKPHSYVCLEQKINMITAKKSSFLLPSISQLQVSNIIWALPVKHLLPKEPYWHSLYMCGKRFALLRKCNQNPEDSPPEILSVNLQLCVHPLKVLVHCLLALKHCIVFWPWPTG